MVQHVAHPLFVGEVIGLNLGVITEDVKMVTTAAMSGARHK